MSSPQDIKIGRFLVLAVIGVSVGVFLAFLWMWTAPFPWSSDPWLINIALSVMAAGPLALVTLAIILLLRKLRK